MLALESSEMKHKVFTIILLLLHLSCISPGVQHPYIEAEEYFAKFCIKVKQTFQAIAKKI